MVGVGEIAGSPVGVKVAKTGVVLHSVLHSTPELVVTEGTPFSNSTTAPPQSTAVLRIKNTVPSSVASKVKEQPNSVPYIVPPSMVPGGAPLGVPFKMAVMMASEPQVAAL